MKTFEQFLLEKEYLPSKKTYSTLEIAKKYKVSEKSFFVLIFAAHPGFF